MGYSSPCRSTIYMGCYKPPTSHGIPEDFVEMLSVVTSANVWCVCPFVNEFMDANVWILCPLSLWSQLGASQSSHGHQRIEDMSMVIMASAQAKIVVLYEPRPSMSY